MDDNKPLSPAFQAMQVEAENPKFFEGMDDQQKEFFKLLMTQEELHPDLVPYLEKAPKLGTVLKHPLYFEMFYTPQRNALINRGYAAKKEYVEKKIAAGNFSGVLGMYERPYRIQMMFEYKDQMTDEEYWSTLGWVWTDSENLWQYRSVLGLLLNADRPGRDKMMDDEEKKFLAKLPPEFVVYRGHHGRNKLGHSWTLSFGKAHWFAERFEQKRRGVLKATVKKEHVIAVLLGRNEFEVVVEPKNLTNIKVVGKVKRKKWLQDILDEAWAGFKLSRRMSVHGLWHWEKVERNAAAIAKLDKEVDKTVVRLFALLHDCKRENEDDDKDHGKRAGEYVAKLYKQSRLPITEVQKELLVYACNFHNDGQVSENPTIGACWDADRLDLPRVGINPDPKLLSTKAGKSLVWRV